MRCKLLDSLILTAALLTSVSFCHVSFDLKSNGLPLTYADVTKCVVVLVPSTRSCTSDSHHVGADCEEKFACDEHLDRISAAFEGEKSVHVQYVNDSQSVPWIKKSVHKHINLTDGVCSVVAFPRPILDRTCLTTPPPQEPDKPLVFNLVSSVNYDILLSGINSACHTFRLDGGELSIPGHHRQYILDNLFSVQSLSNAITSHQVFTEQSKAQASIPQCERVGIKSWNQFFIDYLQLSKPVIITGAMQLWEAKSKWTNEFLRLKYGDRRVHIKLSPTRDYEGIEPVEWWEGYQDFHIPAAVRSKLQFPDLVVPRPAPVNMNFSEYIDLMENIGNGTISNASAYLEYSSIRNYFPELEKDISEMSFVKDKLLLRHLNIWLSDGNTLGKLHFDPFDNFLCMVDGKKELILFEPHHNHQLYEAHIPEAEYSVEKTTLQFHRKKLLESTSMVMSPVDIRHPDFDRFPLFKQSRPLNCTIHEGDVLFMPSFWWHEVQSYPSQDSRRNLAINFWYEPFLTKEFPCPECELDINPFYTDLL